jgi:hypothetical protein
VRESKCEGGLDTAGCVLCQVVVPALKTIRVLQKSGRLLMVMRFSASEVGVSVTWLIIFITDKLVRR